MKLFIYLINSESSQKNDAISVVLNEDSLENG